MKTIKKNHITILSLLLFLFNISAVAGEEKDIDSKIQSVNVFLQKAEVTRSASAQVGTGMTDIVLHGLSQFVDPNSIQVSGTGNATIMSVSHRMNHLNKAAKSDKVQALETEIKALEDANVTVKYKKEALQEEKSMILANKSIGGANSGVSWEELENVADFFRERLVDISMKWTLLDKEEKENNRKYNDATNQLRTLTTALNKPTSEVVVKVHSKTAQQINLSLTYLVHNAGWTPLYDLRAEDGKSSVDISLKANVYQNTGIEWTSVPLTLSTGNPNLGAVKPELNPWYLYLQALSAKNKKGAGYYTESAPRMAESRIMKDDMDMSEISLGGGRATSNSLSTTAGSINTNMKQLSTEYTIALPQTIPTDNKEHMVNIKEFTAEAFFEHAAVPKLDKDAFLMAILTDWEQYDWISGEMNVFYDGTYVGKTFMDITQVEDTMALSLGRDKKVVITREKIKDYCETKSVGLQRKKTTGYEIIIKNNKRSEITLNLQDQLPISQQEQIEVKVVDISGAKKEDQSGFLNWDITLKPGETKKVYIKFEVKYPRKYTIPNL